MNSANSQFSQTRAASKTQFPISCLSVLLVSFLSLVFLGVGALPSAAADETLNNASVIKLQGLELGDAAIIEKIKTSKCDFDTSIEGLEQLKKANVSNPVIAAMIATKAPATVPVSVAPVVAGDPNDPSTMHSAGIWVLQENNGQKMMTKVAYYRPQTETKVGGYNPFAGPSHEQYVYLAGAKSQLQLSERRPTFYFYFVSGQQLSTQGGSFEFMNLQNPEEFMLTRFEIKDGQRQLPIRKGNAWYNSNDLKNSVRGFQAEKAAEGIYKILINNDLVNGEYAFSPRTGEGHGQCFPFGISTTNALSSERTITDPEIQSLCGVLKSDKPDEVVKALKTLRGKDAPEAVLEILPCLKSSNSNVIRDACRTLAVLGNNNTIPSIEPLLKHSRKDVRKDAQDAIDILKTKS